LPKINGKSRFLQVMCQSGVLAIVANPTFGGLV